MKKNRLQMYAKNKSYIRTQNIVMSYTTLFNLLCLVLYSVMVYKTIRANSKKIIMFTNHDSCSLSNKSVVFDKLLDELHLDFSYLQHWRM